MFTRDGGSKLRGLATRKKYVARRLSPKMPAERSTTFELASASEAVKDLVSLSMDEACTMDEDAEYLFGVFVIDDEVEDLLGVDDDGERLSFGWANAMEFEGFGWRGAHLGFCAFAWER